MEKQISKKEEFSFSCLHCNKLFNWDDLVEHKAKQHPAKDIVSNIAENPQSGLQKNHLKAARPKKSQSTAHKKGQIEVCPLCHRIILSNEILAHLSACSHLKKREGQSIRKSIFTVYDSVVSPLQKQERQKLKHHHKSTTNWLEIKLQKHLQRQSNCILRKPIQQQSPLITLSLNENAQKKTEEMKATYSRFLLQLEQLTDNNEQGLLRKQISELGRSFFDPQKEEDRQHNICPICYNNYEIGEQLTRLRCNHKFHPICITTWLHRYTTCPICKKVQTDRVIQPKK